MTDPAFTLTPDPHACSPTLTPSLTPTLTPTLTPALTPTLVVAAACPKGHYRTGCGGLQFHDDSSNTRTQMFKAMASQCDFLHGPSGSRLHH